MAEPARSDEIDFAHMPGHLVRKLQQVQHALFMQHAADVDMPPVQFAALAYCALHPGVDQASLARAIAYDPVTVGGVVSRLEAKGWVRREPDLADKRVRRVTLTDVGAAALAVMSARVHSAQLALLSPLEPRERTEFMRLVEKLLGTHGALLPGATPSTPGKL